MLVVADSLPINILVRIDAIGILPTLFDAVAVPREVCEELSHPRTPESVRQFVTSLPSWVSVRSPTEIRSIPPLDRGEEAAIALAQELALPMLC